MKEPIEMQILKTAIEKATSSGEVQISKGVAQLIYDRLKVLSDMQDWEDYPRNTIEARIKWVTSPIGAEEVFCRYTDTAGHEQWYGVQTGHHAIV